MKVLSTTSWFHIRLCNSSINFPSHHNKEKFKSFRNAYNKVIRAAKKLFYENELLKHQSNLKKTWQTIKSAINKKTNKSSSISSLRVNYSYIMDSRVMADHFNEFFTSMPAKIVSEIKPVNSSDIPHFARNFFETMEEEGDVPLLASLTTPWLFRKLLMQRTVCNQNFLKTCSVSLSTSSNNLSIFWQILLLIYSHCHWSMVMCQPNWKLLK